MPEVPVRPPRIAVVEDDLSLLAALAFALEADGYDVSAFTTAAMLLEQPVDVECLVVDLKLPDMDGLELVDQLRERGLLSPAILITTNPSDRCRRAAARANVEIVEKPLIDGELRRCIEAAIVV